MTTSARTRLALCALAMGVPFAGACAGDDEVFADPDFEMMDIVPYDAAGRGVQSDGAVGDMNALAGDVSKVKKDASAGSGKPPVVASFSQAIGGSLNEEWLAVLRKGSAVYTVGFTQSFGAGAKDGLAMRSDGCGKLVWARAYGGAGDDVVRAAAAVGSQIWLAGSTTSFGQGLQAWLLRIGDAGAVSVSSAFGGAGAEEFVAVIAMDDGGAVAVGNTDTYGPAAPKYDSLMVLRINSKGQLVWGHVYGKKYGTNKAHAIVVLPNGGFAVAGSAESWGAGKDDLWLLRLDGTGKFHWAWTYGTDQDDEPRAVLLAPDGGFLLAGYSDGFGAKGDDVVALKVNGAGAVQWMTRIGTAGEERAYAAVRHGTGYLLGGFSDGLGSGGNNGIQVRLTPNGKVIWVRSVGGKKSESIRAMTAVDDGGVLAVGYTKSTGQGQRDAWIARTEANGGVGCDAQDVALSTLSIAGIKPVASSFKQTFVGGVAGGAVEPKTTAAPASFAPSGICSGSGCL